MRQLVAAAALLALSVSGAGAQQGVPELGWRDRFRAANNPAAYEAQRRRESEQNTYKALRELGATDKEALAGATNPQFLQALLPLLEARRQQSPEKGRAGGQ
jgi:hypothetical protein